VDWQHTQSLAPKQYTCGHCGSLVGPNVGYYAANTPPDPQKPGTALSVALYLCSFCKRPTYFFGDSKQVPGPRPGNEVAGLPGDIDKLYREARDSFSVSAYTASVLTCRKILMNLAVSKGAEEGASFVKYVDYLADRGYVPPDGRGWVDHIRQRGNEANHEIQLMTRGDAEELISFVEMLLKFIYEFPARVPGATAAPAERR
jgi:hypothetical protein